MIKYIYTFVIKDDICYCYIVVESDGTSVTRVQSTNVTFAEKDMEKDKVGQWRSKKIFFPNSLLPIPCRLAWNHAYLI